MPVVLALIGAPIFGWAKPVPVSINRLRHPRNQSVLRGARRSGDQHHPGRRSRDSPSTSCCTYGNCPSSRAPRSFATAPSPQWALVEQILLYFGIVNIILAVFNLIPIPPLDGSALIERLLPVSALPTYYQLRMGFMVVVLLLVVFDQNLLSSILGHVENWYINLVI